MKSTMDIFVEEDRNMDITSGLVYYVPDTTVDTSVVDLISEAERQIYEVVILVVITFLIGLCGVFTNIINIIIFAKQGLSSSVNIGLMGLAVADLLSSLTIEWYCISFNPLLISSDIGFYPPEVQHLTAGMPHGAFACITNSITAYITAERCLCISAPLRVKRMLTPKKTTVIVCFIYVLVAIPVLPEYATAYLGLKRFDDLNKTMVGLVFKDDRYKVEGVSLFLYAVLTFISFIAVIIFTFILVVKLRQKTKWRQMSTFENVQSETISKRDKSAVKMVIVIACIFIVNFSPTVAFFSSVFVVPELNIAGRYRNMFLVAAAFSFITDALNASINIVSYYTMSSKYRQTFRQLFSCFFKDDIRHSGGRELISK
ncbi:hypothetical protein Btru_017553 [Bulinus truncatus]|nr:hypothetical protein Btru_017553 [Bulinus truncatus]